MRQFILFITILFSVHGFSQSFEKVKIGEKAPDFKLNTIHGDEIQLSERNKGNSVVLVVLRGWPGYQCPICTRQVGGLMAEAEKFSKLNSIVIMVYPGPNAELQKHAKDFSEDFDFPKNFYFVVDPDYSMVNKYGLRWDAPNETAYPSTFVINKEGKIVFSKVSTTHGGRSSNEEIIKALSLL